MKKTFRLSEIDCANCANEIERAVCKIEGVASASVAFMAQKLTVDAPDSIFEEVMKKVEKVIKKVEPDCKVIR